MATALTPRQLAMQQAGFYDGSKGYGQGQESAAYRALTPQQQAQVNSMAATPATPALQEPLHSWEKTALTGLSNTGNTAGSAEMQGVMKVLQQMTGGNYDFLGQGNTATQSAIKPVTMDEITGVANPYAEGLKSNLSATAQKLRAQIDAGQGSRGARSFGDTSTGVQHGLLNDKIVDASNQIDYQAFDDARAQLNTERNRSLSGGGQFGNLAGTQIGGANALAGVAGDVRTNSINDILNQLKSGAYVRDYNQNINDVMRNDILGESQYPAQQLSSIMQLLQNYQSGGSYHTPGKTSTATQVGGILGAFGF